MGLNLFSIFKNIRIFLSIVAFYIGCLNIFYIAFLIKGRKQGRQLCEYVGTLLLKRKLIILIEIVFVLGIFSSPPVFSNFENTNIGSFFEKDSYQERYYVYIRKDTEKFNSYKVEADIRKCDYGYPSYTEDGDETFIVKGSGYFIEKAYLPNGGFITFLDDETDGLSEITPNNRLHPEKEASCQDNKGNEYHIYSTTEKVR